MVEGRALSVKAPPGRTAAVIGARPARPHPKRCGPKCLAYVQRVQLAAFFGWLADPVGKVSYEPCGGGDYPPCYRVGTESAGRYDAWNPSGCVGMGSVGCFGKWQFGLFWAGKLGLPADYHHWSPAEQDEAARILWDGGRGCANWAAC